MIESHRIMWSVAIALVPGALMSLWVFGAGVLVNMVLLTAFALAFETACVRARGASVARALGDGSATVSALLIGLALPPETPIHVLAIAACGAIVLAKHLYGGLGHNLFNPAMVGYALVLVSFPAALATWPDVDGTSGATALTSLRYREGLTIAELVAGSGAFGALGARGFEWVNAAFLAGGLWLMWQRIIAWRVSAAMMVTLVACALAFWDGGGSASTGSPLFHLFSGGTLLAALFVATDPVTHPAEPRAQLTFGVLVGAVTFAIRAWGSYPDGIAFAVLLGNAATPWLDHTFTRGRLHDQTTG
jgi:electron transport complex protein RnfD